MELKNIYKTVNEGEVGTILPARRVGNRTRGREREKDNKGGRSR